MRRKPRKPRPRIKWADVPFVFVQAPSCYYCGSNSYESTKSISAGDGATTRKAICRSCGEPFRICVEQLPNFGVDD